MEEVERTQEEGITDTNVTNAEIESVQVKDDKALTDCIIEDITTLKLFDIEPFSIVFARRELGVNSDQISFVHYCDPDEKSAERWELTRAMGRNVAHKECGHEMLDKEDAILAQ